MLKSRKAVSTVDTHYRWCSQTVTQLLEANRPDIHKRRMRTLRAGLENPHEEIRALCEKRLAEEAARGENR